LAIALEDLASNGMHTTHVAGNSLNGKYWDPISGRTFPTFGVVRVLRSAFKYKFSELNLDNGSDCGVRGLLSVVHFTSPVVRIVERGLRYE
jgi:hypothetical protein